MQQGLDALELARDMSYGEFCGISAAIDALRAALAAPEDLNKQEALREAYAVGYYEGRAVGTESNPFEADDLRLSYRHGYDAGVADYCRHHVDDEGNER